MGKRVLVPSVLLFALFALAACGGRTLSDESEAGADPTKTETPAETPDGSTPAPATSASASPNPTGSNPGSGNDSTPGDPFPVCPASAPNVGDACATQNQGCAYVDFDKGTCISFTCDSNGRWQSSTPAGC
jgi:hypothetical protein